MQGNIEEYMYVLHALIQRCNAGKCIKSTHINGLPHITKTCTERMKNEGSCLKKGVKPLGARNRANFLFVNTLKVFTRLVCCVFT